MKYKAINFGLMTVRSVPCTKVQFNKLKSGDVISLPKNVAEKMLRMNIIERINNGGKS